MLALKGYQACIHISAIEELFFKEKCFLGKNDEMTNNSGKQAPDKSHLEVFYINDILCLMLLEQVMVKRFRFRIQKSQK